MSNPSISGILNIDKPSGPTSHDIVVSVRRLTGQKRIGHAGTLDPLATGVLLLCAGQATRVAEYLMGSDKRYQASIRLGIETDTYDAEGAIIEEHELVDLSCTEIEAALRTFVGEIEQVPPIYSAIKLDGQPLYKRARRGESLRPKMRKVCIESLKIVAWDRPLLVLDIVCSSGTYVRSLAHDLGQLLGVGGHVSDLVRLASGDFALEDAISLTTFADAAAAGTWRRFLLPMDAALTGFPALTLDRQEAARLVHGQAVPAGGIPTGDTSRVYGPDGALLAIAIYDRSTNMWRPKKVFKDP